LEPLLDRLAEDPTRVVCPVINQLNHETLRQDITPAVDIGIFEMDRLQFGWTKMFPRELARRVSDVDPFRYEALKASYNKPVYCLYLNMNL